MKFQCIKCKQTMYVTKERYEYLTKKDKIKTYLCKSCKSQIKQNNKKDTDEKSIEEKIDEISGKRKKVDEVALGTIISECCNYHHGGRCYGYTWKVTPKGMIQFMKIKDVKENDPCIVLEGKECGHYNKNVRPIELNQSSKKR